MKNTVPDMTGEIEKSVLVMFYEGADIPPYITEGMFQHHKHRIIFSALKHLKADGKKPDLLMLNDYLISHKLNEQVEAACIAELNNMIPSTANSQYYFDQFLEAYRKRELKRAMMTAIECLEDKSVQAADIEASVLNELQNMDSVLAETKPVTLRSFADICRTDYEPLQWIVEGVIPEGVTLLFAPPKKGKSILATHLVDAVASGGMAFGGIPVKKRDTLYLALEDNGRRIKDRLLRQESAQPDNAYCVTMKEWGGGGIAELDRYKKACPSIELAVVDTLGIFSPSEDNSAYSENYRLVSKIHQWATKNGVSVVLVHHSRKGAGRNEGEGWADEMMGSQGISGAVDTLIFLHKKDTAHEGTLRIQGRDIEPTHKRIVFDSDFLYWRILGDAAAPEEKLPEKQEEVLAVLEEAGPDGLRSKEIAEKLGKSESAAGNLLKALKDKDKVFNPSHGTWALSHFHTNSHVKTDESSEKGNSQIHVPYRKCENVNLDESGLPPEKPPESSESPPEAGPPPEPELFEPPPDMPPGLGGRYDYLYTNLVNRGLSHEEADKQAMEQVNREYRDQAAGSELEIW
ncbi:MAG: AAA family ATPase [Treponema sp.]|jgi:hypothetical protein|nr:AAA family ATPase [Treponema sp.]